MQQHKYKLLTVFNSSFLYCVKWCEQKSVVTVTAGYTPTHIYIQTSLIKKKLTSYRLLTEWPTIGKTKALITWSVPVKCVPEY